MSVRRMKLAVLIFADLPAKLVIIATTYIEGAQTNIRLIISPMSSNPEDISPAHCEIIDLFRERKTSNIIANSHRPTPTRRNSRVVRCKLAISRIYVYYIARTDGWPGGLTIRKVVCSFVYFVPRNNGKNTV